MQGYLRSRDRRKIEYRITPCRSWQLVADAGRDDGNRRKQIFRSFSGTEAQARIALRKLLHELETGRVAEDHATKLVDWIERWISHKISQSRKARTITSYRDLLRLHIVPTLGNSRLSDLRTLKLQKHFDQLHERGRLTKSKFGGSLSPATVRRIHQALSAALDFAVKMGVLSTNPAKAIELPRGEQRTYRILNHTEAEAVLAEAQGTYLRLFILIGYCIGLRRGEIFGLLWDDVDWETSIIHIKRQITRGGMVDTPKSRSSIRQIQLPQILLSELKLHREVQQALKFLMGASYTDNGYVFATEFGHAFVPDNIYSLYRAIFKRANVVYVRPHDLRHSAASLLLAAKIPIPDVAAILGHANSSVTMAIYAHAIGKTSLLAASAMDARFE